MWPDAFLAPTRLYALLAVFALIVAYAVLALVRQRYAVRFTNIALLDAVAPKRPGWRRHVAAAAFLLATAAMVLAWARPADEVLVPRERATVVLAIDTSLSMEATDIAPNRLVAAQQAALRFIEELPPQINLGLVSFDGVARVRVTPTTDRTPVRNAIETLELGPATAIGEAIFASLDAIAAAPVPAGGEGDDGESEAVPARIVLMTDGKTTVGRPDADGAEAASAEGVPVSTIAFGTDRGTIVIDGEIQPVPVDHAPLRLIADRTGGRFYGAESLDQLQDVYADIGSSIGFETEEQEVTDRFAGYAVVLLLLSAGGSLLWFQRLP
jgi:Ca-activated chloride channel homolog